MLKHFIWKIYFTFLSPQDITTDLENDKKNQMLFDT